MKAHRIKRALHKHITHHHVTYKAMGDLTILVLAAWIAEGFKHHVLALTARVF